jgi:hypothetical protein
MVESLRDLTQEPPTKISGDGQGRDVVSDPLMESGVIQEVTIADSSAPHHHDNEAEEASGVSTVLADAAQ